MIVSMRNTAVGAVCGLLLCATALAASNAELAAAIDKVAQAAIAAGESPGLQVAVYKDGQPVVVKGYGAANLELNVPVNNDSVFRIGSVTKQFTAAALLKLEEEGKLSLDDKLSRYYPDFPNAGSITLKQMLHHTSGIYNYTNDAEFMKREGGQKHTTDEWIALFAKLPKTQDFAPGTAWNYSNTAYFILGGIVEKVAAKPLATVLHDRFFGPLGLTHTALDDETQIVPGRVAGYDADGPKQFRNASFLSMTIPGGAGAMRSSADDLAHWNAALFGGKILKPASLQAMTTPGKLNNGQNSSTGMPPPPDGQKKMDMEYGYALSVGNLEGHLRIGHGGGIPGFNSSLNEFPNDHITVAVIANGLGKDVNAIKVTQRIERIVLGLPPKD